MRGRRCWARRAAIVATGLLGVGLASRAHAQEIRIVGPLRAAPAGRLEWRAGRVELAPIGGLGVLGADAAALGGGEIVVHPADDLGVGVFGVAGVPIGAREAGRASLRSIVGPELVVVPITSKAALFRAYFPFDVHAEAGAAWIDTSEDGRALGRLDGSIGAGLTAFTASSWSLSVDYRAFVGDVVVQAVTLSVGFWPQRRRWDDE